MATGGPPFRHRLFAIAEITPRLRYGDPMKRFAFVIFSIAGTGASAGAWPQPEGEYFLSFGSNVALIGESVRPVHYDPTLYLEYGYSERLTIGIDGFTADRGEAGSVFAFGRWALDVEGTEDRFALGAGLGVTILPDGEQGETFRLTAHWGRGLDTGWLAIDAQASFGFTQELTQTKIDSTWGYRIDDTWTATTQFEIGTGLSGDVYTKVSPSIVYSVNDDLQLRAGVVQALSGDYGTGISLQSWLRF